MRLSRCTRIAGSSTLALSIFFTTILADTPDPNVSDVSSIASQPIAAAATPTTDASTTAAQDVSTSVATNDASITKSGPLATITGGVAGTDAGDVPTLSSAAPLPTLTAINNGADTVNTYPPPSVPPTSNAPFMQQSSLPSGTVFIVVGAILAFLTFGVLAWRGFLVWSLNRAVKKNVRHNNMTDTKSHFRPPAAPMYKNYTDGFSSISLGPIKKGGRKDSRPPTAADDTTRQTLFFSPTAGPGASIINTSRGSTYLPSGYYAAGAPTTTPTGMMAGNGSSSPGISLSNLSSQAQGYQRARDMAPSPPDSPAFPARRPHDDRQYSTSTLDLSVPAQGRAPSAYLEDLLDNEALPPQRR